ncbi:MAG TPA: SDR family oxidoreductase [Thermoanaerobaculia bacterium]|nr:SDR family oxidoreductase [Thermoanaerobaculia bacterium]
MRDELLDSIAIVGLACRFPGARNAGEYWRNLAAGVESVRRFSDDELAAAGVPPEVLADPAYVKAAPVLDDIDLFDAALFGYSPREAELMDPQQRLFLESAWEALEDAGYDPRRCRERIGVYAGARLNTYWLRFASGPKAQEGLEALQTLIGNEKDYLATQVAYRLDLRGPCIGVQTACSTALVAVSLAAQGLLAYQCDLALAGAVAVRVPQTAGYFHRPGGLASPDGHCRAFSADAGGSVFGSGLGIVVLKRLEDALADGDSVRAVLRGAAVNNDGAQKAGFTALSEEGQAEVIATALATAGVEPRSVTLVEAHSTGTPLGDPLEVAALNRAFRAGTADRGFCALGSVKSNIGHLDCAAGAAGLIKAVLALEHRELPPSLNFSAPNPAIDFAASPFYVNTTLRPWPGEGPRRAGVSSFGIGGTNAHVVLEEAPVLPPPSPDLHPPRPWHLLPVSAATPMALQVASANLHRYLLDHPELTPEDVAFTLQVGRQELRHRRVVLCPDLAAGAAALAGDDPEHAWSGTAERSDLPVVFLFPGRSGGYPAMAAELAAAEPVLRAEIDRCAGILGPLLGIDLQAVLHGGGPVGGPEPAGDGDTIQLDAVQLVVQHALARLWISWGLRPEGVVGQGVGELVAACVAGVLSLEEALSVVARPTEAALRRLRLAPPRLRLMSGATGTWLSPEEATDAAAWAARLGRPASWPQGTWESLQQMGAVLLEVGSGGSLGPGAEAAGALAGLPQGAPGASVHRHLLATLGRLWLAGARVDWTAFHDRRRRRRVPLPTYPFEGRRYWIEDSRAAASPVPAAPEHRRPADRIRVPVWRQTVSPRPRPAGEDTGTWLVVEDASGVGAALVRRLRETGRRVVSVVAGEGFTAAGEHRYRMDLRRLADHHRLMAVLRAAGDMPSTVVHASGLGAAASCGRREAAGDGPLPPGLDSLLLLVQVLAANVDPAASGAPIDLRVLTAGARPVFGDEDLTAEQVAVLGACAAIPGQLPGFTCQAVDLGPEVAGGMATDDGLAADRLAAEMTAPPADPVVAYRHGRRWVRELVAGPFDEAAGGAVLRGRGVYMVTGAWGETGLAVARGLARRVRARLVLVDRFPAPPGRVQELEALGAAVLTATADVTSPEQVSAVVARARESFGSIHGAVHAAGEAVNGPLDGEGEDAGKGRDEAERAYAARVRGAAVLSEALGGGELDFLAFWSPDSASAPAATAGPMLGPLAVQPLVAAAAGAALDAAAHARSARGAGPTVSIHWLGSAGVPVEPEHAVEVLHRVLAWDGGCEVVVDPLGHVAGGGTVGAAAAAGAALTGAASPGAASSGAYPRPDLSTVYVAPRDGTERAVAEIWQRLLGIDRVGLDDDFFELGGHSLLALRLIGELRAALAVDLPPATLFAQPTVAGIAAHVAQLGGGGDALLPPIERLPRDGDLPLSFAQERQWFLARLEPDAPLYNQSAGLLLTGWLDTRALQRSLDETVRRHESLRSSFPLLGEGPVQHVAPPGRWPLPWVDLTALPAGRRRPEMLLTAARDARRPFDLARGPLVRALLVRLAAEQHAAWFTMHHIVGDQWSAGVLIGELAALYGAFVAGRPSPLPEPPIQYADFAGWQRRYLTGDLLAAQLCYWRRRLAPPLPVLDLRTDRARPARPSARGAIEPVALTPESSARVRELARREGATPFMVLLAVLQVLLHRLTGQLDLVVGAPVAGRSRPELDGMIGYFINALALRTDLSGDPTFRELLARVRETTLGAYAHQDLPFEKLVEELRPERHPGHSPVFQVVFNYQNAAPADPAALPGLTLERLPVRHGTAKYDFTLYMGEAGDRLAGAFEYKTDLFEAATMARLREELLVLAERAVTAPDTRLGVLVDALSTRETEKRMSRQDEVSTSNLKKLKITRRRSVNLAQDELVRREALNGSTLPLVLRPNLDDVDLAAWVRSNTEQVERDLLVHGGILFRGFAVASPAAFESFVNTVTPELANYVEGSSPRVMVGDKVYTSTEYPAEYFVSLHNELSYAHKWPSKIFFYCDVEPQQGGETPIADSRKVWQQIDPAVRSRFAEKGVLYTRNLHGDRGAGLSWQTVFETADRDTVEAYCREGGIDFRWRDDGGLTTRQVRPATIRHPKTGEPVWFNQVDQWHPSNLGDLADALLATTSEEELPINAYFGDGSPLDPAELEHVRQVVRDSMVSFPWQKGDVLMLDNTLTAHGRMPFTPPRRVLVAMGGGVVRLSELEA